MKVLFQQLTLIVLFLAIGASIQTFLFKQQDNSYSDALMTKQWLWIVYFLISHVITERVFQYWSAYKLKDKSREPSSE
jgi:hypothetical protein